MSEGSYQNIPAELRSLQQWVLWRYEARTNKKTGRPGLTKVLTNPRNGRNAKSNDPATWGALAEVLEGLKTFEENDGIGFVFSAEDGFFGADLDGCRNPVTGEIAPWAQEIITALNSYTEVSPTATGVKIFCRGRLPEGAWHKKPPKGATSVNGKKPLIEVYDQVKFFTVTGEHVDGTPWEIADGEKPMSALQARYAAKATPKSDSRKDHDTLSLSDSELLQKARGARYGHRFARLFDHGDPTDHGGDHSAADWELIRSLRFWTQADEARMKRLFCESALYREEGPGKSKSAGYLDRTISKAIAAGGKVYDPAIGIEDAPHPADAGEEPPPGAGYPSGGAGAWADRNGSGAAGAATGEAERMSNAPAVDPVLLADVIARFRRWLYLPDDGHIKVTLGAHAANLMEGDPVWLMLIGGSSCGKTEIIASLDGQPRIRMASSLSGEGALLSGTSKREKAAGATGGLLQAIGSFGVLLLKDFTTILSMKHEQRAMLLAALREIYDGSWTRHIGTDGGKTLEWRGKLGLIAGCTPIIDSHHAVIGTMGERFIFYRVPQADPEKQADAALNHDGKEDKLRKELAEVVHSLFRCLDLHSSAFEYEKDERARLIDIAAFAAQCRSGVERDGRTREIELIPDPEAPARLAGVLLRLLRGMLAVGVDREEAWRLLARVAVDSMPALRWAAARHAYTASVPLPTADFATALDHPTTTVKRALEDLNAHKLLKRTKDKNGKNDLWALTDSARRKLDRIKPYSVPDQPLQPENSLKMHGAPSPSPSHDLVIPNTGLEEFSGLTDFQARARHENGPKSADGSADGCGAFSRGEPLEEETW